MFIISAIRSCINYSYMQILYAKLKEYMMKNDILPDLHMVMSSYRASLRFQTVFFWNLRFPRWRNGLLEWTFDQETSLPSSPAFLNGDGILKSFVESVFLLKPEVRCGMHKGNSFILKTKYNYYMKEVVKWPDVAMLNKRSFLLICSSGVHIQSCVISRGFPCRKKQQ